MKNSKTRNALRAAGTLALVAALTACTSKDSPTAPQSGGGGGVPSGTGNAGAWTITVTASPNTLHTPPASQLFGDELSTITVAARNTATGVAPPDGSTLVLSCTGGTLGNSASTIGDQNSVTHTLTNGEATDTFRPSASDTSFTAVCRATFAASSGQTSIQVIASGTEPSFAVDHVDPNVGDPAGGLHAVIFGQQISGTVKVTFGGSSAQVLSSSGSQVRVVVPASAVAVPVGSSRPVDVVVTNAFGTTDEATDTIVNGFIYANGGSIENPVIFTVDPPTGDQEGGTQVTISGNHFDVNAQVVFRVTGGGSATIDLPAPTLDVSTTRIVALSPDIRAYVTAGTLVQPVNAQVRVINPNGAVGVAGQQFTYGSTIRLTSIAPGHGPFNGGTRVTIFGSGFDEPLAVSFGGVGQHVVSVSGTEIIVQTSALTGSAIPPCNGQTDGDVVVTNIEGGASATGLNFTYDGPPNPLILGVSPAAGAVNSTTTVSGQGFDPAALRVLFGGADGSAAPIQNATSFSIQVMVPTPPPSFTFTTEACDGNGDNVASGTRNLPTPISITVRNLTAGCETTLSNAFTLQPCGIAQCQCLGDTSTPPPTPQCSDGIDNDGDGFIDLLDPQCTGPNDDNESA